MNIYTNHLGMLYLRARWYQPHTGRFSSPDPIIPDFTSPQSINRYLYALGNPTGYVDPTGSVVERSGIPEDFQYSCRCGWIDWNHAGPGAAYSLIRKVLAEPPAGTEHTVVNVGMTEVFFRFAREYVINEATDNESGSWFLLSDSWRVALGIYKDLSEHFEAWQAHSWNAPTSFSEEDLPSNLIGFHVALREITNQFVFPNPEPSISAEEKAFVRRVCDCVDHPGDSPYGVNSLAVFDAYGEDDWQKVRDWNYPHIDFDDGCVIPTLCAASLTQRSWPAVFSIPAPAPMGQLSLFAPGYFWEYNPSVDGPKGNEILDNVWELGND